MLSVNDRNEAALNAHVADAWLTNGRGAAAFENWNTDWCSFPGTRYNEGTTIRRSTHDRSGGRRTRGLNFIRGSDGRGYKATSCDQ